MSHLTKAIQNKVGSVLAAPRVKYNESKMRGHDRKYAAIKSYQAMRDSGSDVTNTPEFRKAQAVYEDIKSKRK